MTTQVYLILNHSFLGFGMDQKLDGKKSRRQVIFERAQLVEEILVLSIGLHDLTQHYQGKFMIILTGVVQFIVEILVFHTHLDDVMTLE